MTPVRQRIVADPARNNGNDANGVPGDCVRAAVASLCDEPLDAVPHFVAAGATWWDDMRAWARNRGDDFVCVPVEQGSVEYAFVDYWSDTWSGLMIGSGPSPRGPWRHVVIVDRNLDLVHDPHPSDAGLVHVEEVIVLVPPYDGP